jgi:hypothetical protein
MGIRVAGCHLHDADHIHSRPEEPSMNYNHDAPPGLAAAEFQEKTQGRINGKFPLGPSRTREWSRLRR